MHYYFHLWENNIWCCFYLYIKPENSKTLWMTQQHKFFNYKISDMTNQIKTTRKNSGLNPISTAHKC